MQTGAGVEDRGQLQHCEQSGENVACRGQKKRRYLHHVRRLWWVEVGWAVRLQPEPVFRLFLASSGFFFLVQAEAGTEESRNNSLERSVKRTNIPSYCRPPGRALIVLRSEVSDQEISGRAVREDQVSGPKIKATAAAALFSQGGTLQSPRQQPSGPSVLLLHGVFLSIFSWNLDFLSHVYGPVVSSAALMDQEPQCAAARYFFVCALTLNQNSSLFVFTFSTVYFLP